MSFALLLSFLIAFPEGSEGDRARALEELGQQCRQFSESLASSASVADRRVALYFLLHGEFPNRQGFKKIGVSYEQWRGSRDYASDGKSASLAFHSSRLEGYRAVQDLLSDPDFAAAQGLDAELGVQRLEEVGRVIFPLLSVDERRVIADQEMLDFIVRERRLPLASARSEDFKKLGFEYKQWVGSGEYGQKDKKAHLRFHPDAASAWKVILAALEDVEANEHFSEDVKFSITNQIRLKIARAELSIHQQRDVFDELLIQSMIRAGKILNDDEFADYGLFYDRWAGTKEYAEGKRLRDSAYYPDTEKGWAAIARKLVDRAEDETFDQSLRRRLIRGAREKRDLRRERNWDEIKEDWTDDIVIVILRQGRVISYDEILDLDIDASRLMGTGNFKSKGLYADPAAFWTEVRNRVRATSEADGLLPARRTRLLEALNIKIRDARERRSLARLDSEGSRERRTRKVAQYILTHGKAPVRDELQAVGFTDNQWLGTGSYRPGAPHAHLADHASPQEAYRAVLTMILADEDLSPEAKAQAQSIIEEKIRDYDERQSKSSSD